MEPQRLTLIGNAGSGSRRQVRAARKRAAKERVPGSASNAGRAGGDKQKTDPLPWISADAADL